MIAFITWLLSVSVFLAAACFLASRECYALVALCVLGAFVVETRGYWPERYPEYIKDRYSEPKDKHNPRDESCEPKRL